MDYQIDKDGSWLSGANIVKSPNCDSRPLNINIELLVIHAISLPPKQYGGKYVAAFFTNPLDPDTHPYFLEIQDLRVSSHLFISREGHVTQYVPFNMRAWHAGKSSFKGRSFCNDYSIGIELEGCDEEKFCDVQYLTLARITELICQRWQKIKKDCIVGHSDIAPERKTDPGPFFDMDYYFSLFRL